MYLKFNNNDNLFTVIKHNTISSDINIKLSLDDTSQIVEVSSCFESSEEMELLVIYSDISMETKLATYVNYYISKLNVDYKYKTVDVVIKPKDLAEQFTILQSQISNTEDKIETLNEQINPQIDTSTFSVEEARKYQLNIINKECQEVIYLGIDVETSVGTEHFSLTLEDQSNITALYTEVVTGKTCVLYHSDGNLCRQFTAEEIAKIAIIAKEYVTYCTTKCNHLHAYINRLEDKETILSTHFESDLPEDLLENMNSLFTAMQESEQVVESEITETETESESEE